MTARGRALCTVGGLASTTATTRVRSIRVRSIRGPARHVTCGRRDVTAAVSARMPPLRSTSIARRRYAGSISFTKSRDKLKIRAYLFGSLLSEGLYNTASASAIRRSSIFRFSLSFSVESCSRKKIRLRRAKLFSIDNYSWIEFVQAIDTADQIQIVPVSISRPYVEQNCGINYEVNQIRVDYFLLRQTRRYRSVGIA
jgi:hypothetical protein